MKSQVDWILQKIVIDDFPASNADDLARLIIDQSQLQSVSARSHPEKMPNEYLIHPIFQKKKSLISQIDDGFTTIPDGHDFFLPVKLETNDFGDITWLENCSEIYSQGF